MGGLNDVLAPPQLKKLEQESTAHTLGLFHKSRTVQLSDCAAFSQLCTGHSFLTVFAEFSHRPWATGFHFPQVSHRYLTESAHSFCADFSQKKIV